MTDTRWLQIPADLGEDLWKTLSKRMGEGYRNPVTGSAEGYVPAHDVLTIENHGEIGSSTPSAVQTLGSRAGHIPLLKRESTGEWNGRGSITWTKHIYFVPDGSAS